MPEVGGAEGGALAIPITESSICLKGSFVGSRTCERRDGGREGESEGGSEGGRE